MLHAEIIYKCLGGKLNPGKKAITKNKSQRPPPKVTVVRYMFYIISVLEDLMKGFHFGFQRIKIFLSLLSNGSV